MTTHTLRHSFATHLVVRIGLVLTFAIFSCICLGVVLALICSGPIDASSIGLSLPLLLLASWFLYLMRRGWRVGLELTDTEVRIRRVANDYVVPLECVASIGLEDWDNGESGIISYHTARDASGRICFRIATGVAQDEFVGSVRRACGLADTNQEAEPGAAPDGRKAGRR